MAENIVAVTQQTPPRYQLPEAERQAIIQQSPRYKQTENIERQRQKFIKENDGDDGTEEL